MSQDYSSGYNREEDEGIVKVTLKKGIKKGKKGIFSLLFSRIGVLALLILLQIAVIVASLMLI